MKHKCFCCHENFRDLTKEELLMMLRSVNRFSIKEFAMNYKISEVDLQQLMMKNKMNPLVTIGLYQNVKEKNSPIIKLSIEDEKRLNLPDPNINIVMPDPFIYTYIKKPKKFIRMRKPRMPKEIRRELRRMSKRVIKEVYDIYANKCDICGSKENLTIHHIRHISDGGESLPHNLQLLCSEHHAEMHKGENVYALMKSRADKLKEEGKDDHNAKQSRYQET